MAKLICVSIFIEVRLTAQAMKLLGIKQRRTREILVKMVENGWLRKEGASRSTIYVKNTEGR